MDRPKVLLYVPDGQLRAQYEMILRSCGLEPVDGRDLDELPEGTIAGCVLTGHQSGLERPSARLLAAAIPVIRIDPFIRHAREHLPFDVVLPACSEPRELITALRHLVPGSPRH
jgi:hypothetical protein